MTDVVSDGQPLPAALENGPDEPKKPLVLDFAANGADESPDWDARVKVSDVHLAGISGPFGVAAHGVSKVLAYPCAAPPRNGRAAVWVHSSHQDRLHDFDDQTMDNAVRPERNDLQLSLLLAAVVIDRLELWPGRHIASL